MCDCYAAKCDHDGCTETLPVHLEDFDTGRDEISVYCAAHLPRTNVRVFTLTDDEDAECGYPKGWRMGIRYLTDNARERADGNEPNLVAAMNKEDR